jgi:hypothetical protein
MHSVISDALSTQKWHPVILWKKVSEDHLLQHSHFSFESLRVIEGGVLSPFHIKGIVERTF